MIISLSVLVITIIVSGTYALYKAQLSKNIGVNTTTHGLAYYINYVKGTDITAATLNPSTTYEGGASSNIEFWKKDDSYDIYGKIELTVNTIGTNLSNSPAIKYAVVNNGNVLKEGSLKGTTSGSKVTILKNLYLEQTKQIYTVYVWLDNSEELGDISNESLSISVDCTASLQKDVTAVDTITKLYADAEKTIVTNNNKEYNMASSVLLMNDRLGGTTTDLDGGNIRYYGASPNNYIYFNCTTYPSASCEVWRIVGVFDGKLKIVRNTSIGNLAWDQDKNSDSSKTTYDNDWSTATLQKLLNEKYYYGDTAGIVTYYSGSTGTTTTTLNMGSVGIKNDKTRNMIASTNWQLGHSGFDAEISLPDQIYASDTSSTAYNGNPKSWTGKIGLLSPSDQSYGMDLSVCSVPPTAYSNFTGCSNSNWVSSLFNSVSWLINANKYNNTEVCFSSVSYPACGGYDNDAYRDAIVFPTLYLDPDVSIEGGSGTSSSPYTLSF